LNYNITKLSKKTKSSVNLVNRPDDAAGMAAAFDVAVDEGEGFPEAVELEGLRQRVALEFPARQVFQSRRNLRLREWFAHPPPLPTKPNAARGGRTHHLSFPRLPP